MTRLRRHLFFFSFVVQVPDILQAFSPVNFVTNLACHRIMWPTYDYSVTPRQVCSTEDNTGTCSVSTNEFGL